MLGAGSAGVERAPAAVENVVAVLQTPTWPDYRATLCALAAI
jgi:hypothetical protein